MIIYCTTTYNSRMAQTKECIRKISQFGTFDRMIVIVSNSPPYEELSDENRKWLLGHGCEVYERLWNDNFPEMRNAYLEKCQIGDIVCVSDADEWYSESLCRDIREVVEEFIETAGVGLCLLNVHDITYDENMNGEEVKSDTFYKNLIYKKTPETEYKGVGQTAVHEELVLAPNTQVCRLPDEYYYLHVKEWHEVWERAARNVVAGGGGNNVGDANEEWVVLKEIMAELNLEHWPALRHYLINFDIKANEYAIGSQEYDNDNDRELHQWILRNRCMGYDWENEMCDMFRWFRYLHPEFIPEGIEVITDQIPERAEIMAKIEQLYLDLLGRHADSPGKQMYTQMIEKSQGEYSLEHVRESIMESSEYKSKHPTEIEERIPLSEKVKFDVNMIVTEEVIQKQIIERSTIFQDRFMTPLRLGRKWLALLTITHKEESGGKGIDETPLEEYLPFIKQFKSLVPPEEYNYVLDVGAGVGLETHLLEEEGYNVQGITFGNDNIERGKKEYGVHLIKMDMHDLVFPPNVFDATFSIQTFEHAFAPWLHILEMRRVLRDGGRVFIVTPSAFQDGCCTPDILDIIWHTSVLFAAQITSLFEKAGFDLIHAEEFHLESRIDNVFVFEKLPDGEFESWGYLKYIMKKLKEV